MLWLGLGLPAVLPALMVTVLSLPFIVPNATALAFSPYGREAGTVSALIGVLQFAVGAIASPSRERRGRGDRLLDGVRHARSWRVTALVTRRVLVPA